MDLKIITKDLLLEAVLQNETEEEKLKMDKNGINLLDVKVLKLDFVNIYKIDHLWMMSSLQKLILTYNHIEKIENLESLINLVHLDLSFNKIRIIQNLNELIHLEVLFLNHNRISDINNMDGLKKLEILSLSGNLIENYEEVTYLRRFKNMKILAFDENPCSDDQICKNFIIACLPTLKYFNYKFISNEEKYESEELFRHLLMKFDEIEMAEQNILAIEETQEEERIFNEKLFIGKLNCTDKSSLDEMFSDDISIINLENFNAKKIFDKYNNNYKMTIKQFSLYALNQHNLRDAEITNFLQALEEKQTFSVENSREIVQKYLDGKLSLIESELTGSTFENIQSTIKELWIDLMTIESDLYEQSEEMRLMFEKNITELVSEMIIETQKIFSQWKIHENEWYEEMQNLPIDEKSNDLHKSYQNHTDFINSQEIQTITNVRQWLENTTDSILSKELQRHRNRITEISHFIEYEKSQLKKDACNGS